MRVLGKTLFLVVLLAPVVRGEEPDLSDKEQTYLAESIAQRAQLIARMEQRIAAARKALKEVSRSSVTQHEGKSAVTGRRFTRPGKFSSQAQKDKAVKAAKARVAELTQQRKLAEDLGQHFTPAITTLRVGAMGRLVGPDQYVRIVQVLGPSEMIVEMQDNWVMLTGFSSVGMVDDKKVILSQIVEIVGTHRYTTVLGALRTIFKAAPFDNSRVVAYEMARAAEIKAMLAKAISEAKAVPK